MNERKIILDLCGGTGSWSVSYAEAGYDVRVITLPEFDIFDYEPPDNVYGILAAPPCTDFSIAGTHTWKAKDESGSTTKSLAVVKRCFEIIENCRGLKFYALENPIGRLQRFIGKPSIKLNFMDFGCTYSKYIQLWGRFKIPMGQCYNTKSIKKFDRLLYQDMTPLPPDYDYSGAGMTKRAAQRSITYRGFAEAFFRANP
jgi:hypothetical protein